MAATSDNYDIVTSGITYTIASDYVNTAHHQIVKIAYGADNTATYVSGSAPLPVGLCGSWGRYEFLAPSGFYSLATTIVGTTGASLTVVGVSGGVAVGITVGTLNVAGSNFSIRNLYGGATLGKTAGIDFVGIQGIASGYPIGITVSAALPVTVSSFSNLGIFGVSGATAVGVTFSTVSIRGLTTNSDSITVYGTGVGSSVPTSLYAFAGSTTAIEAVYSTNNALNVNVSTITGVTVSALDLDIRNLNYTTDTVTIVGQGAADSLSLSTVPTYMNAAVSPTGILTRVGGSTGAGWCGAAVNMYLVNSGFSFNAYATFSTGIGISQAAYNPVPVAGSSAAVVGLWVAGDTLNGPVIVKGYSGGYLPIQLANLDTPTSTVNATIAQVKTNTDFLIAAKKALYDPTVSVGAFDFTDSLSIYSLIKNAVNTQLQTLANTVSSGSVSVAIDSYATQPSFMARTNVAGYVAKNLTEYNSAAGYTCSTGVRLKVSRIATGANASQNEFMCVISEADAAVYGSTAGTASYVLYHGDELFLEVDNINKLKVFYPAYSTGFAPHNTGTGITFSFYAS